MKMNVVIKGLAAVTSAFQSREGNISTEIATALNQVGQEVFAESQRRVPVDTGNLRSSARIDAAKTDTPKVTISYGGTAAGYALVVHETHGSRSKYLESPAREAAERLNQAVKQGVRRGGGM